MGYLRSGGRRARGPRSARLGWTSVELLAGALLLGAAAVAGLAFVHRPWPNRLDVWGYGVLPANLNSRWAHDLAELGSLTVLIVSVIAVFLVGILRDWVRAIACASAPLLAVLVVQNVAKPLVGRHLGLTGGSSYPSGTVAAVSAVVTAGILVAPAILRPLAVVVGLFASAGVAAAVIVLRWHYPTDALGGFCVGAGAVLLVDALFHVPWAIAGVFRPARPPRNTDTPRRPGVRVSEGAVSAASSRA